MAPSRYAQFKMGLQLRTSGRDPGWLGNWQVLGSQQCPSQQDAFQEQTLIHGLIPIKDLKDPADHLSHLFPHAIPPDFTRALKLLNCNKLFIQQNPKYRHLQIKQHLGHLKKRCSCLYILKTTSLMRKRAQYNHTKIILARRELFLPSNLTTSPHSLLSGNEK